MKLVRNGVMQRKAIENKILNMEIIDELTRLEALLNEGAISQDEFKMLKKNIISESLNENLTQNKPKKKTEKAVLESKSQGLGEKQVLKDTKTNQTVKNTRKKDNYKVKRLIFLLGIAILVIISLTTDPVYGVLIGLFGGLIAIFWGALTWGQRYLFFFYAPYILFTISSILFSCCSFICGEEEVDDMDIVIMTILLCMFLIAELLTFLFEYIPKPKCSNCGKRLGMMKISESDFSRYDYIGTKSYDIRSKSGEKIGEYEGPVSRTSYYFTGYYQCKYCKDYTSMRESSHYDN